MLGAAMLAAALLGSLAPAQQAAAQATSRFDGDYVGQLTLVELIQGDCTTPPLGAVYPLSISGGQVRFAYVPRFATTLTGSVAENGSFRASAPTKYGRVEMTGQIRGNKVNAQIVSPSCVYNFVTAD
jgi:hypothetical protein